MSVASTRGLNKGVRTLLQTIAGGGLTAVTEIVVGGLKSPAREIIFAVWTAVVALAQNYLETAGRIPVLLPTPGLVPSTDSSVVEATVEATTDVVGDVTGVVTDTTGKIIGEVTDLS